MRTESTPLAAWMLFPNQHVLARVLGRFDLQPFLILEVMSSALVLACAEAVDVLPRSLSRDETDFTWRQTNCIAVFVVGRFYPSDHTTITHMLGVRNTARACNKGTWDVFKRMEEKIVNNRVESIDGGLFHVSWCPWLRTISVLL
jgi:hypothetical protein